MVVEVGGREGALGSRAGEGGGFEWESEATYGERTGYRESVLLKDPFLL